MDDDGFILITNTRANKRRNKTNNKQQANTTSEQVDDELTLDRISEIINVIDNELEINGDYIDDNINDTDNPINYIFQNKWTLWLHHKNNRDWDESSFVKIYEIDSIKTFWGVYNAISDFSNEIFFLMKDDIMPLWENEENKYGGTWSLSVSRKYVHEFWINLSLLLVGCKLGAGDNEMNNDINGISIRPKFSNSIVKIWMKDIISENKFENYFNVSEIEKILNDDFNIDQIQFSKYN